MDRTFVDEETGESISVPTSGCDVRGPLVSSVNNAETGEPEINVVGIGSTKSRRTPFQIPKEVKETLSSKGSSKRRKNLMDLEPVPVGASFGQINPICLFFLAVLCFRWFLPVLMFVELSLHIWAHHKNKALKDSIVYFRSPFHGISCEFCALCQNETCMDRVGKMQQIRMDKFLRQCNYMKRVVT